MKHFVLRPLLFVLAFAACFANPFQSSVAAAESSPASIEQYRAAVALQNQQLYDLAAEEWESFVKEYPDDPYVGNAQHYLGVCYFQTDAFQKADQAFQAAMVENGKREVKAEVALSSTLLNQGLARFNLGQSKQGDNATKTLRGAITTFRRLKAEFPGADEEREANYYLAESLFAVGKKDDARKVYAQAVNDSPQHPLREKLLYGLGVAYQETEDSGQARATFDRLLREFPQSEFADEITTRSADTLFAAKKYAEAAAAFATVAGKSGSEFADYAMLQQAACEFNQKKYADAGRRYATLVKQYPKSEYANTATLSAGKCLHLGGDPAAVQWLAKAARLKGDEALEAAHWLARVQIKANKADDAIASLKKAIDAAANSKSEGAQDILPQLRLDLADALYENKDRRADAAKLYEQVASEYRDHEAAPQARYMAAFSALQQGDHAAARKNAQKFLSSWPKAILRPDVLAVDAESELQMGEHKSAGDSFERLVQEFPKRPECDTWISRRAICLNRANQHDRVIHWLESKIGDIETPELKGESQFLLGSAYLHKGELTKAMQLLRKSIETSPNGLQSDRALLLLGEAQQQADKPELALASIRQLLKEHPNSKIASQARFREAELLYAEGDFKRAAASYVVVLKDDKHRDLHPSALFGLAWSQLSLEDYDHAAATLDALTSKHRDHDLAKKARYAMGVAYQQKEDYDKALAALNTYLQENLDPTEKADALYLRGLCRVGKGESKQAINDFRAVLKNSPNYADTEQVLYELAWACQDGDQPDQAAAAFRKLAEKFPNGSLTAESWYRVAEHHYAAKKYEEAAEAYQQALQKSADHPEIAQRAAHKLGWTNYQRKEHSAAEQAFRKQLQMSKDGDPELTKTAQLMAAECAFQQKEFERAYRAFQAALPSADGVTASLRSLSLLHAGQAAGQLKQWQASADALQKCVEELPDSDTVEQARYELGFAMQNLNQTEKAKAMYEQVAAATTAPVGARARFMLGELQFADQDYNGAIRTFAKVFSGYGGDQAPEEYHTWQADSLFEAARCCESTKRIDGAKRFYQQLIKTYPNSDKVNSARAKLKTLGE